MFGDPVPYFTGPRVFLYHDAAGKRRGTGDSSPLFSRSALSGGNQPDRGEARCGLLSLPPSYLGLNELMLLARETHSHPGKWRSGVISEKHGIVGMVDRIMDNGTFSIIRAAGAMPFGTYSSDRLRITCIAFCLEEMTGKEVNGGNVEYIPDGVSRFHTVQPRDRGR